jgi:acyl carrier protein
MSDAITPRLQEVFREVFRQPDLTITRTMTAADVQGWDSLRHIELIVAVETAFSVRFKTVEVSRLQTVGDLIDRLTIALNR